MATLNSPEVDALNLTHARAYERDGMRALYALVGEGIADTATAHAAIHGRVSPAIQLYHIAGRDDEATRLEAKALDVAKRAGAAEADIDELSHGLARARWSVENGRTYGSQEVSTMNAPHVDEIAVLEALLAMARKQRATEDGASLPALGASGVGRVD